MAQDRFRRQGAIENGQLIDVHFERSDPRAAESDDERLRGSELAGVLSGGDWQTVPVDRHHAAIPCSGQVMPNPVRQAKRPLRRDRVGRLGAADLEADLLARIAGREPHALPVAVAQTEDHSVGLPIAKLHALAVFAQPDFDRQRPTRRLERRAFKPSVVEPDGLSSRRAALDHGERIAAAVAQRRFLPAEALGQRRLERDRLERVVADEARVFLHFG